MFADIHNHTCHFSPDARMKISELIEASVNAGLDVTGITEHFEYDNPDPADDIQTFDLEEYNEAFGKWRSMCPPGLKLLKGIEFGYQTHTAAVIDRIAGSNPFDIVLLSNHLFRGRDVYYARQTCYDIPKRERHAEYIGIMAEMCEKCSNFDVAAHFDYINRYNPNPEEYVLYEDCPKEFDRMFEALISKDKCLEINTKSILKESDKGSAHIMPDEAVIRRYLAMGGKMLTLGSDSHTPATLGVFFRETSLYLASLGIKELYYFENRTPVSYGISSANLE